MSTDALCNAVHYFEEESSRQPYEQVYGLCAAGLKVISENLFPLGQELGVTRPYLQEMEGLLTSFGKKAQCPWEDPQAAAFQLVENMAVVLREFYTRTGKAVDANTQAVFSYFETSGHWQADDGTLVSTCYHSL
ncbi:hypothetical protein [Desulfovibrio cuneatus]|uniref:hypothetical protein n=1 Tax=Desulfovibrio cuneatus TaxID=159728 RepID=UPI0012EB92A8|nr:hypothetical protein [Desulfovibrio cuneatus]